MIIKILTKSISENETSASFVDTDAILSITYNISERTVQVDSDAPQITFNGVLNIVNVGEQIEDWRRIANEKEMVVYIPPDVTHDDPSHDQFNRLDYTLIGMAIGWLVTCSIWQYFT